MRPYEIMMILDPTIEEKAVAPTVGKFMAVITGFGGSVDNVDLWGKRRLAYPILKKDEGYYAVVLFTSTPEAASELDRQLGLNESVLRTKLLRAEARA
jgi:small subunit ribosomal protein S6